jgi:NADH dehydrogenase FAD-containing subunit
MTEPIRVTNPFIDNYVEGRAIGIDVPNQKLAVQLSALGTVTGSFKGIASDAPCRLEPDPPLLFSSSSSAAEQQQQQADSSAAGAARVIQLNYDYLICAVGTSVRSTIVSGAKEYCFNLKTSQDSKRLRTAIGESLEYVRVGRWCLYSVSLLFAVYFMIKVSLTLYHHHHQASRPDVSDAYYCDSSMQFCDVEQQELASQERQRRLRFVIVGGGPTGVELAGELSDFFAQVCRTADGAYQRLAKDVSIILVHGGADLLPSMNKGLRDLALESLKAQGVQIRLNTRLQEVGRDFVRLKEKGSSDDDEEETIPVGLTCWAAGNSPVPFVSELLSHLPESAVGPAGRINVDNWLRCPTPTPDSFGSILVLGDAAYMEADSKYSPPAGLPQTAQVAGQQGAFTARMLNRGYDLQETPPRLPDIDPALDEFSLLRVWLLARGLEEAPEFNFLGLGLLAYVGGGQALNQVELGDVPIFDYAGTIAFALWKSVYLSKQAATRNQALIAFDWWRTELFGRDITRL